MKPKVARPSKTGKARNIISVPVTPEQLAELDARAGQMPLSAYVRGHLFAANDNAARARPIRRKRTRKQETMLASTLALLGPVAQAMRPLAQAIASGLLPMNPDTEAALLKACADIAEAKSLLMKALGIRER